MTIFRLTLRNPAPGRMAEPERRPVGASLSARLPPATTLLPGQPMWLVTGGGRCEQSSHYSDFER